MKTATGAPVDPPLKILFLISDIGQGGDWSMVKTLARVLSVHQAEIWLNGLRWGNPESSIPADSLPIRLNRGWRCFRHLPRLAGGLPKDLAIIHAHSPFAILVAILLRLLARSRAKIVFTFHWPTRDSALRGRVKRLLFSRADAIHTCSVRTREQMVEGYGVSPRKCALIYLGVPADRFQPRTPMEVAAKRRELGLPSDAFVAGYLGRFDEEKNVSWILRFVRENAVRYPDLFALVIGGGALRKRLEEEGAEAIRAGRIVLLGRVNDPEAHYPVMDLHLLPSAFEAFALTVAEAAYCGVPTLRTDVEGAVDQIADGADGFLCEIEGGYDAFARKLRYVLDDRRTDLPAVGERSGAKLRKLCHMETFGERMESFYRAVMRDPKGDFSKIAE